MTIWTQTPHPSSETDTDIAAQSTLSAQFHHRLPASYILWARMAGALAALIGFIVLADWMLGHALLRQTAPFAGVMKANTAAGVLLAGVALWLLAPHSSNKSKLYGGLICAGAVLGIGLVSFAQDLFGFSAGIDELLFTDWDQDALYPGRMSPVTALNFILLGAALSLLGMGRVPGAQACALVVTFTSSVHLVSYLFSATGPTFLMPHVQMALHTAMAFVLISIGVLCARAERGLMRIATDAGVGGDIARRLLPLAIIIPIGLGWLRIQGQRLGFYDDDFGVALYAMSSVALFTAVIWWNARILQIADEKRRQVEQENKRLNAELEQRVEERTAQLQAAVQELEAFSYSVSHDLRTPLRGIDGYSRILLEDYEEQLDEDGKRYLNSMRAQTQQMSQLIDDLLAFSRLNRHDIGKQQAFPNEIVKYCLQDLQGELEGRNIEWRVDELPPCLADPVLLKQVYINLLGNAIKFTRRREQAIIEVGFRDGETETIYFVKDNGAGFDMRYVDKLFGVFQRLHRAEEFEGTGVGLANVQRIIHRHGGWVRAEGEVDQGATMTFALPKVEVEKVLS